MFAKLALDSSEYDAGLDKSKEKASSFGDKVKTAFKVGGAAIAAVTTATAALTTQMVKGAGEVAAYGDNIDKMSQKMGLSATAYQEWDAVMQHSGTSIESLQAGMKTLANAVESGNKAFERLGISQEQIANMNNEELFSATITALQNVENETERTYLAGQLLGRGATELGALLNTSAEETQAMKDRVHELGGVMSDDAVKAAAKYQDSLQDMTTAFSGLKRGMMGEFLPSITTVMDGLTELFAGGNGLPMISEGVSAFVDEIGEITPKLLDIGSKILLSLSDAIIANLPVLIEAATQAVLTLATGFVEQLPSIVKAGLDVILSLANGIAKNLPELIPTIVDVIMQIVDTLTEPETLSALIDASIAIILALANGLIDALPKLLEKVPEIVANIVTAFIENAPKLLDAGFELINSLVSGITGNENLLSDAINSLGEIFNKIKEFFGPIVDSAKEFLTALWDLVKDIAKKIADIVNNFIEQHKTAINAFTITIKSVIKTAFEYIRNVITTVVNYVRDFVKTEIDVITGIFKTLAALLRGDFSGAWENAKETVSQFVDNVKNLILNLGENIGTTLKNLASNALNWGKDMIQNFINGITQKWNDLKSSVSNVAQTVKNLIGFSEPKEGPLSNFHTYAPDMMELFAKGIRDNTDVVTNQINKSFDFGEKIVDFGANVTAGRNGYTGGEMYGGYGYGSNASVGEQTINVDVTLRLDDGTVLQKFAHKLRPYMNDEAALAGGVLA